MSSDILCREKIGFLTLRRCKNVALLKCYLCQKFICNDHKHVLTVQEPPAGDKQVDVCRTCFQQRTPGYESRYIDNYTPFDIDSGRYASSDYKTFDGFGGGQSGGGGASRSFAPESGGKPEEGQSGSGQSGTVIPLAGATQGMPVDPALAAAAAASDETGGGPFEGS